MPAPWSAHAQARILGNIHGQDTVTVLNFATNTVINGTQELDQRLKELANAIKDCVLETLVPAASIDWTFNQVEVVRTAPDQSDPVINDNVVATNGTAGVQGVSVASQLVSNRTGQGGRKGRGKLFLPPAGEDHATQGKWDPAALALIAAFCACMAGKFIGGGATSIWRLGVLSRKKEGDPPVLPAIDTRFRETVQLVPVELIAYMTSRKVGRGS